MDHGAEGAGVLGADADLSLPGLIFLGRIQTEAQLVNTLRNPADFRLHLSSRFSRFVWSRRRIKPERLIVPYTMKGLKGF